MPVPFPFLGWLSFKRLHSVFHSVRDFRRSIGRLYVDRSLLARVFESPERQALRSLICPHQRPYPPATTVATLRACWMRCVGHVLENCVTGWEWERGVCRQDFRDS